MKPQTTISVREAIIRLLIATPELRKDATLYIVESMLMPGLFLYSIKEEVRESR
jgi:hypothetical protein